VVLRWPPLFFDKIHSTRLLLTNHARFFTINCILTVLQMFKKNNFWHFFAKFTFRIAITGKCSLSGYCYPESDHFPDNNNRKVKNVRTLFYLQINNVSMENQDIIILMSLSGYCYPESDHFPDSNNRKVTRRKKSGFTFRIAITGKWSLSGFMIRKVTRKKHTFANNSTKSRPNSKKF